MSALAKSYAQVEPNSQYTREAAVAGLRRTRCAGRRTTSAAARTALSCGANNSFCRKCLYPISITAKYHVTFDLNISSLQSNVSMRPMGTSEHPEHT
eukprot:6172512-Pleurochrysis_carterae.AAC.6